jgi:hypothetical protein
VYNKKNGDLAIESEMIVSNSSANGKLRDAETDRSPQVAL